MVDELGLSSARRRECSRVPIGTRPPPRPTNWAPPLHLFLRVRVPVPSPRAYARPSPLLGHSLQRAGYHSTIGEATSRDVLHVMVGAVLKGISCSKGVMVLVQLDDSEPLRSARVPSSPFLV